MSAEDLKLLNRYRNIESPLDSRRLELMTWFAKNSNDDGYVFNLSIDYICQKLRVSKPTAIKYKNLLIKECLILEIRKGNKLGCCISVYLINRLKLLNHQIKSVITNHHMLPTKQLTKSGDNLRLTNNKTASKKTLPLYQGIISISKSIPSSKRVKKTFSDDVLKMKLNESAAMKLKNLTCYEEQFKILSEKPPEVWQRVFDRIEPRVRNSLHGLFVKSLIDEPIGDKPMKAYRPQYHMTVEEIDQNIARMKSASDYHKENRQKSEPANKEAMTHIRAALNLKNIATG